MASAGMRVDNGRFAARAHLAARLREFDVDDIARAQGRTRMPMRPLQPNGHEETRLALIFDLA